MWNFFLKSKTIVRWYGRRQSRLRQPLQLYPRDKCRKPPGLPKKTVGVCQGVIAVATVIKTHSGVCCPYSLCLSCETDSMYVL